MSGINAALIALKSESEEAERICSELQDNCSALARIKNTFLSLAERNGIPADAAKALHSELTAEATRAHAVAFKLRCERSDAYLRSKFNGGAENRTIVDRRQPAPRRSAQRPSAEIVSVRL